MVALADLPSPLKIVAWILILGIAINVITLGLSISAGNGSKIIEEGAILLVQILVYVGFKKGFRIVRYVLLILYTLTMLVMLATFAEDGGDRLAASIVIAISAAMLWGLLSPEAREWFSGNK